MKQLFSIVLLLAIGMAMGVVLDGYSPESSDETAMEHAKKHLDPNYVCPMHSQIVSAEQGTCPICGMDLVEIKTTDSNLDDGDDMHPTVRVSSTMINNMGVRVAQVERKTLVRQIETPGFVQRIMPDSFSRYLAPAKGKVSKLYFEQGHWYEEGEPLIDLELDDLVLVQQKHLELLAKETQKKEAEKKEAGKTEDTIEEQVIDTVESDESDTTVNEPVADKSTTKTEAVHVKDNTLTESDEKTAAPKPVEPTIEKTRLLLKAAGMSEEQIKKLEETKVTSPVITLYASHAGAMKKLNVAVGDKVKSRQLLFTFGGLVKIKVLANAFQRDATWVRPGQDVDIILPHDSNKPYKGKVSSGAVSININSQNIGIELSFVARSGVVKSGTYVVGNIYGQVREDTLTLPREAVIYSRNEKRVIVALGEGRFKPVTVDIGISNDKDVEILDGLEEGDTVVVSAQFLIDSESSLQASYRRMTSVE